MFQGIPSAAARGGEAEEADVGEQHSAADQRGVFHGGARRFRGPAARADGGALHRDLHQGRADATGVASQC